MKFSTLLQYVTPHRTTLVLIVLLMLVSSVISLANPWIAGLVTGSLLGTDTDLPGLRFILLGWLALLAARGVLTVYSQYQIGGTAEEMAASLRSRVYEHLQALPLTYHQQRKSGDVLSLLANDAEIISYFVTTTLVQLLPQLFVLTGAMIMMVLLSPVIAGLALALMPVYFIAMKLVGRRIRPLSREWIDSWSALIARTEENLGLLPVIKAFTREAFETARFGDENEKLLVNARRQIMAQAILTPTVGFLAGAGLLLLLWVGLGQMESGRVDAAGLVSLLLYAMLLTQPISGLAGVYGQVMRARGAADRLLEFFSQQAEPVSGSTAELPRINGRIEFENVSFAYPGRPAVFENFSLIIEPGETIGLTGPNGAGKSTLAHLLLRFIEPASGRVLVDGVDIATVDIASLRRQIGLVAQHTLLMNGTIGENISYGQPLAGHHDIKKAAKAARAEQFIKELPDGYETVVGDQGVRLSGGQRQRLSLARTLLGDPPVLILDEATAMFDPRGETEFIEECKDLFRQRTVLLITHRPEILSLTERVVRLAGNFSTEPMTSGKPEARFKP